MINIQALKPGDLLVLLNSTPLGQVSNERNLRRIRQGNGLRIGTKGTVDLLRFTARLILDRQPRAEAPPTTADIYAKAKEQLRQKRERMESGSQPTTPPTESGPFPLIPSAPFAARETKPYKTKGQLKKDVGIARRMLDDPLWPISKELRAKVVEWLEVLIEGAADDRTRVSAIKALISADKLNMSFAKLELMERVALQLMAEPDPATVTAVPVNSDAEEKPKSVFERLRELEKFYASRDSQSEGSASGQGS